MIEDGIKWNEPNYIYDIIRWEFFSGCGSWPTIEYCLIIDLQREIFLPIPFYCRSPSPVHSWVNPAEINKIAGMNYDKGSWTAKREENKDCHQVY